MKGKMNADLEYGLVLEGGGARGAYQIGVWQALKEYKIKIKGIVGTSVGALNGALVCMDSFEEARDIWENITYSQVMKVQDSIIESIKKHDYKNLDIKELLREVKHLLMERGLDISPLKQLVTHLLDEECIRTSQKDFGLVTISLSDFKFLEVFIKDIPEGQLTDYLLASAYLPIFKEQKLHGKRYLDGGIYNNVPTNMLIDKGYKNIIVVRIFGLGVKRKLTIDDSVHLIEISPIEDLGGILEFSKARSCYNIQLGYYDALRIIRGLEGVKYYIECHNDESYYFYKLINLPEELVVKLLKLFKTELLGKRGLFEVVIPRVAKRLKIGNNEKYYKVFVLRLLEYIAEKFKFEKFYVYTDDELLLKLKQKILQYERVNPTDGESLRSLILQVVKEL